MTDRDSGAGVVPEFDVALWGYDRQQVERCLHDLTARLDHALGKLDSVEVLQQQLCQAQVELEQLRLLMERQPHWSYRLAEIMRAAEELREVAEQAGQAPAATR